MKPRLVKPLADFCRYVNKTSGEKMSRAMRASREKFIELYELWKNGFLGSKFDSQKLTERVNLSGCSTG